MEKELKERKEMKPGSAGSLNVPKYRTGIMKAIKETEPRPEPAERQSGASHTETEPAPKQPGRPAGALKSSMAAENAETAAGFRSAYTPAQRTFAFAGLVLFIAVLAALLFTVFTGGSANTILALLFVLTVVPCILYAFRLYVNHTVKRRDRKS